MTFSLTVLEHGTSMGRLGVDSLFETLDLPSCPALAGYPWSCFWLAFLLAFSCGKEDQMFCLARRDWTLDILHSILINTSIFSFWTWFCLPLSFGDVNPCISDLWRRLTTAFMFVIHYLEVLFMVRSLLSIGKRLSSGHFQISFLFPSSCCLAVL